MDAEVTTTNWDGQGSLQGKNLRIATLQHSPLSGALRLINGTYEGTGVAFEIIRLLESALNFTHHVRSPSRDPVDFLQLGEADVAAALLPVPQQLKPEGIIYSTAVAVDEWVILMKRPEELTSGADLFAPFDTHVWLATLGALVAIGPVMYALLLVRRHLTCQAVASRDVGIRPEFPLSACVWFAYSAIMKQGSTLAPANDVSRLLFATWWMFITILTSFYTANLTAFLTLSRFTLPIEEARELAHYKMRWFGHSGGALEHAILKEDELSYLRNSLQAGFGRLLKLRDKEILELVFKGQLFLGERSTVERLVFRNYMQSARDGLDHAGRCTLVFTSKPFMIRPLAFAFPANSSLPSLFNPVLRSLVEGGVIRHELQLDLPDNREICPLNLGNSERQLRNADLFATYLAMFVGIGAATVAFLLELMLKRCKKQKKLPRRQFVVQPLPHSIPVPPLPPVKPHPIPVPPLPPVELNSKQFLFYPRDFSLPPVNKSALLMDPHFFIVHRALNVGVNTRLRHNKPKFIAYTE